MIETTPATISTRPGSHVIHTIGNTGSLRVRFAATERQMPHRFCTTTRIRPKTPKPNLHITETLTASQQKRNEKAEKKLTLKGYETKQELEREGKTPSRVVSPAGERHSGWFPGFDPFLAGFRPYSSMKTRFLLGLKESCTSYTVFTGRRVKGVCVLPLYSDSGVF